MIEKLRKIRGQKGFTLLELLVVVAIIAILATLILANLNRARKQAQDAKVQSEVKSISDAVQLYQTSNADNTSLLGAAPFNTSGVDTTVSGSSAGPLTVLATPPDPILKTVPTHPLAGYNYHYKSNLVNGSFTYTVEGNLVSKQACYSITDGVATTDTSRTCQ